MLDQNGIANQNTITTRVFLHLPVVPLPVSQIAYSVLPYSDADKSQTQEMQNPVKLVDHL